MKLTTETKKGLTILKLHEKRLDASIAPHFKSKLALMIEGEGEKYLVIDLSQVQAIDSSGIGSLLLAHRTTLAHDGFAAFVGVREPVRDLLKMTHLDKQLYIFNSIQDVLNNLETVETDEPEESKEDKEKIKVPAAATKHVNHTDLDEDEEDELLENLPELPEESIPDLKLSLERRKPRLR
ncbi:MAG: STAS domain-containing protein [Chloroherpetonaceae bacterium]|nr:STAS domain-containing protein [Chloroherpetonaceae bacterium]